MPRSKMWFPQIFSSIFLVANWTSKSSKFGIMFWQMNDYVWSVWSWISTDRAQIFFHRFRPNIFITENSFAFAWLKYKFIFVYLQNVGLFYRYLPNRHRYHHGSEMDFLDGDDFDCGGWLLCYLEQVALFLEHLVMIRDLVELGLGVLGGLSMVNFPKKCSKSVNKSKLPTFVINM